MTTHDFYGSATEAVCLNCGAEAGEKHYAACPCNADDYDGDEPWDDNDDAPATDDFGAPFTVAPDYD